MNYFQVVYFILLTTSLIISFWKVGRTSLKIFPYLLLLSLITEIINIILYRKFKNQIIENIIYQIYIPIEFILLSIFFYSNTQNLKFKVFIKVSVFAYLITDLIVGYKLSFIIFPGHILNLEGLFISIMSANLLLNLPINVKKPVFYVPFLWVGLGLLLYYSSTFIYNGLYNYLLINKPQIHNLLYNVMMKVPNYLLYILLSIGFLCQQQTKTLSLR